MPWKRSKFKNCTEVERNGNTFRFPVESGTLSHWKRFFKNSLADKYILKFGPMTEHEKAQTPFWYLRTNRSRWLYFKKA